MAGAGDATPAPQAVRVADADVSVLAKRALSGGDKESAEAIAALRAKGRPGLEALLTLEPDRVKAWRTEAGAHSDIVELRRSSADGVVVAKYCAAVDAVAGQRDAAVSQLFWYTDLAQAQAEAKRENKAILSLRMLGRLTEEFSCANSRFFRTALYSNPEISKCLREAYVLHWESVRPAPKVMIDFGDGRKLERTITGNSVHYVLDADGRVVDVLPGLYGPQAFLREIKESATLVARLSRAEATAVGTDGKIANNHRQALSKAIEAWRVDLVKVIASEIALSGNTDADIKMLDDRTDDRAWRAIAVLHAEDAKLASASRAMIRREHPDAWAAGRMAIGGKAAFEDPMLRLIRNFERNLAVDTVRNDYFLRSRIRIMLARDTRLADDLPRLNDRVYAEVFLTPRNDPWLGLATDDEYSGLVNGGKVSRAEAR